MLRRSGFTTVEMVIGVGVIGLLASFAVPSYLSSVEQARIAKAIAEMQEIQRAVNRYERRYGVLPNDLTEIDMVWSDPWEQPYVYTRYVWDGKKNPKNARRDKNLKPVNSTYDLYSVGEDGKTKANFSAKDARDDIVRAGDGGYWGLAEDYLP